MNIVLQKIDDFFYSLNRKRLARRHKSKIAKIIGNTQGLIDNTTCDIPQPIQTVLVLDQLGCFGDSLFVNALLKKLHNVLNIRVLLVTEPKFYDIYQDQVSECIDIKTLADRIDLHADVLIDMDYRDSAWLLNHPFSKQYHGFTLSCSSYVGQSNFFSAYLDLSSINHFSMRMGAIFAALEKMQRHQVVLTSRRELSLQGQTIAAIRPYVPVEKTSKDIKQKTVYLNTVGRFDFRSLSQQQLDAVLAVCKKRHYQVLLYQGDKHFQINDTDNVTIVAPKKFTDACAMVACSDLVITPDTAAVHAASAFNIPTLVMFCENDLEYFGAPMEDVWGSLSACACTIKPPKVGLRRQSLALIDNETLVKQLNNMMDKVEFNLQEKLD